ncbi:flagellar hook-associated protein FlgK [Eubacterium oxidoreducens]|uniref:Flagellar hook-associated protein 1 n=1 Tax=Eubacterium oxidoreducens TaxID=1732 RepID=A0A1G6BRP0_EUBOX|nr:flagellar basal body protein [Eubacterium oxidoreducens]SDB23300.1 flagellar hook-associated protein 1 FlgK [Eubacterium oxidoreducens]
MANSMGSLWVGASGLQNSQNAMNITANNLTNVDTTGYVRQQVLFGDKTYISSGVQAAISKQTTGLGVSISDVIHNRDVFLDKAYRQETGRYEFYSASYSATTEIEDILQELDGESFQNILSSDDESLWVAFQELAKDPSSGVNQNLVLQKASLFITRAQAVYESINTYQKQLNTQITDAVDKINELGQTIYELNIKIQKIEAGGVETASSLRDERDLALDELSELCNMTYKETMSGIVKVSIEGVEFINEAMVYEMGVEYDKSTGFATPIWPQLGQDKDGNSYEVFDLESEISSAYNTDVGKLKGILLARGDSVANYTDMYDLVNSTAQYFSELTEDDYKTEQEYETLTGASVCLNTQAEFDTLIHSIVTAINDLLSPLTYATQAGLTAGTTLTDADGNEYTVTDTTRILDAENCCVGSDGKLPPQELFSRSGCERYTEVTDAAGNTYYLYNEEDLSDTGLMYTVKSISINEAIQQDSSKIPYLEQNGEVSYELGEALSDMWNVSDLQLNPTVGGTWTFSEYYEQMVGELGTNGNVFKTTVENLESTTEALTTSRNSVVGVSSDEELTKMIKYQNAYNAASRYINVISEMIEHIVTNL